ncbi:MAG: Cysteine-rich [Pseudomonadota bacterium]|jgi:Cysteine-rich CWC
MNQICSQCGEAFHCASLAKEDQCWCMALLPLPKEIIQPEQTCLCQKCLKDVLQTLAISKK